MRSTNLIIRAITPCLIAAFVVINFWMNEAHGVGNNTIVPVHVPLILMATPLVVMGFILKKDSQYLRTVNAIFAAAAGITAYGAGILGAQATTLSSREDLLFALVNACAALLFSDICLRNHYDESESPKSSHIALNLGWCVLCMAAAYTGYRWVQSENTILLYLHGGLSLLGFLVPVVTLFVPRSSKDECLSF